MSKIETLINLIDVCATQSWFLQLLSRDHRLYMILSITGLGQRKTSDNRGGGGGGIGGNSRSDGAGQPGAGGGFGTVGLVLIYPWWYL